MCGGEAPLRVGGTGWIQVAAFQGAASKFRLRIGWFYIAFHQWLGFNVSEKPGKGVDVPEVALHLGPAGGPALHSSVVNCSAIRALTLQTTLQMAVTRRLFRHIDPPRVPGSRYASYRIVGSRARWYVGLYSSMYSHAVVSMTDVGMSKRHLRHVPPRKTDAHARCDRGYPTGWCVVTVAPLRPDA